MVPFCPIVQVLWEACNAGQLIPWCVLGNDRDHPTHDDLVHVALMKKRPKNPAEIIAISQFGCGEVVLEWVRGQDGGVFLCVLIINRQTVPPSHNKNICGTTWLEILFLYVGKKKTHHSVPLIEQAWKERKAASALSFFPVCSLLSLSFFIWWTHAEQVKTKWRCIFFYNNNKKTDQVVPRNFKFNTADLWSLVFLFSF